MSFSRDFLKINNYKLLTAKILFVNIRSMQERGREEVGPFSHIPVVTSLGEVGAYVNQPYEWGVQLAEMARTADLRNVSDVARSYVSSFFNHQDGLPVAHKGTALPSLDEIDVEHVWALSANTRQYISAAIISFLLMNKEKFMVYMEVPDFHGEVATTPYVFERALDVGPEHYKDLVEHHLTMLNRLFVGTNLLTLTSIPSV